MGNRMSAVIHPEDLAVMADKLSSQLLHGNTIHNENRLVCKDGSVKWVSVKAQLFSELQGDVYKRQMYARAHRTFSFRQILEKQTGRLEVVVTFLAVLELMKMGKIALTQEALFDDMYIETLEPEGEEGELKLDGLEDFEEQE